ncbi:MAG: MarR family winged helix-turn-helix transcriptional regulator [Actinocrinis sp.]
MSDQPPPVTTAPEPDPDRERGPEPAAGHPAEAIYGMLSVLLRGAPRDMGLTSTATLSTLERTGPRRITDLALIEAVSQPSMTVLVAALVRSGLAERRGEPSDKRVTLVAITPAGADYLARRRAAATQAVAQLIDKLPPEQTEALTAAIPALLHLRDLYHEEREPPART